MTFKVKLLIVGVVLGAVALGSWTARGWFEDSKDLAALKAQEALAEAVRTDMAQVVVAVDEKLQSLKANERVIDRGIIREIQQPVFRNVCVPPGGDAFRLLNQLALGAAAPAFDDQGTGHAADTD